MLRNENSLNGFKETKCHKRQLSYQIVDLLDFIPNMRIEIDKFGQFILNLTKKMQRLAEISQKWLEFEHARKNDLVKNKIPKTEWIELGNKLHGEVKHFCKKLKQKHWWSSTLYLWSVVFPTDDNTQCPTIEIPLDWLNCHKKTKVFVSRRDAQTWVSTAIGLLRMAFYCKFSIHTWFQVLSMYNIASMSSLLLPALLNLISNSLDNLETAIGDRKRQFGF